MNLAADTGFFAMGGFGPYVWGSLAMCAAAIAAELLLLHARRRALRGDPHVHTPTGARSTAP